MPRFVHIDHCLCHFGGHEYDYAVNLLQAAEREGYDVVLAANRTFRDTSHLPGDWPVYAVFPFTAYTKHCVWYGGHGHLPMGLKGEPLSRPNRDESGGSWLTALASGVARATGLPGRRERHRLIRGFAIACGQLFDEIQLSPDDHVFFATVTEFDLLGLARYFASNSRPRSANWHLQFHFGLYGGCPAGESARAERRDAMRRQFDFVLQHVPSQTVCFYNTTEQLAAQYNQLNVGKFQYLPYAVSPALQTPNESADGPLRVTCAGAVRRDKKIQELKHIARAVRSDPFFDQKIQLVAQLPERKRRRLGIPAEAAADDRAEVSFVSLPHPLERDAYHELIRRTDIGLFLHDNRRYFAQCSGVLHEVLAAGKPVIVPGGCWLASQIAEPIFAHIENLCAALPVVGRPAGADVRWRRPSVNPADHLRDDELSLTGTELVETRLPVPAGATELVVGFRWPDRAVRDQYVGVQLQQTGRNGKVGVPPDCIVGQRRGDRPSLALFHLDGGVDHIVLRLRNARDQGRSVVSDVQTRSFRASGPHGCPAGSVGLIAAHPAQVAVLLRDMVQHYPHYRDSAAAFSRTWRQAHHPSQTVAMFTGSRSKAPLAA